MCCESLPGWWAELHGRSVHIWSVRAQADGRGHLVAAASEPKLPAEAHFLKSPQTSLKIFTQQQRTLVSHTIRIILFALFFFIFPLRCLMELKWGTRLGVLFVLLQVDFFLFSSVFFYWRRAMCDLV